MCPYYKLDKRVLPADIYLADSECESCIYDDYYKGCQCENSAKDESEGRSETCTICDTHLDPF